MGRKTKRKRYAVNIRWNIDMSDICDILDAMKPEAAAEALGITNSMYAAMEPEERHDYACRTFCGNADMLNTFLNLPDKVEIPLSLTDSEDISDWLSNRYGFCHEGFKIRMEDGTII